MCIKIKNKVVKYSLKTDEFFKRLLGCFIFWCVAKIWKLGSFKMAGKAIFLQAGCQFISPNIQSGTLCLWVVVSTSTTK